MISSYCFNSVVLYRAASKDIQIDFEVLHDWYCSPRNQTHLMLDSLTGVCWEDPNQSIVILITETRCYRSRDFQPGLGFFFLIKQRLPQARIRV